jgi:hypothetical protein
MFRISRIVIPLAALLFATSAIAHQMSQHELDDWFNDDSGKAIAAVNEGDLVFLAKPPEKPVHHHENIVTLDDEAVATGWVELRQCHENLDRVPATQIVFREGRVRDLRIISYTGIKQAWVEGASIQLRDVGKNARLCLAAKTHAMEMNTDGTYHLHSGPFMRRFLDGYYPMHISMEVILQTHKIQFVDITPASQKGFNVTTTPQFVKFDGWFEGRLETLIRFKPALQPGSPHA